MNIELINQLKPPKERDYSRMKKNRDDEPIGFIMHTYMEISRGNSLCSYFISNK
jgi:hypothetical protein